MRKWTDKEDKGIKLIKSCCRHWTLIFCLFVFVFQYFVLFAHIACHWISYIRYMWFYATSWLRKGNEWLGCEIQYLPLWWKRLTRHLNLLWWNCGVYFYYLFCLRNNKYYKLKTNDLFTEHELSNLYFPPCCTANRIPRHAQHDRISFSFQRITYFLILSSYYRSFTEITRKTGISYFQDKYICRM